MVVSNYDDEVKYCCKWQIMIMVISVTLVLLYALVNAYITQYQLPVLIISPTVDSISRYLLLLLYFVALSIFWCKNIYNTALILGMISTKKLNSGGSLYKRCLSYFYKLINAQLLLSILGIAYLFINNVFIVLLTILLYKKLSNLWKEELYLFKSLHPLLKKR